MRSIVFLLASFFVVTQASAQIITRGAPGSPGSGSSGSMPAQSAGVATETITIKDKQGNILSQRPATKADGQMTVKALGASMDKAVGTAYQNQTGKTMPANTGYRMDYDSSK